MTVLSDNINAMFLFGDYEEQSHIRSEQCMIIQKYDFSMHKSRKENGELYNWGIVGNVMTITLSVGNANQLNRFYSRTAEKESSYFSILFAATFDKDNLLRKYSSSIMAEGYIVSVDEDFDTTPREGEQSMFLTVKLLVRSMVFRNAELQTSCFA